MIPRPQRALTCGALLTKRRTYPRWLVRGLVLFAVAMTALAAVASREHHSSVSARNQVLSQYVALEARVVQSSHPALARQLSFTAYRIAQSMAARSALLDINSGVMPARLFAKLGPAYTPADPAARDEALRQTRALTTVTSSTLSPNAQLFAAAGADHLVYLWKVATPSDPTLVMKLAGPTTAITKLAISPDGRVLAISTAGGHVWLFSVAIPARASVLAKLDAAHGKLSTLAFSPSDTLLVAGSGGPLTVWFFRPYIAADRACALTRTAISTAEWKNYVPQFAYRPPCAMRTGLTTVTTTYP